MLIPDCEPCDSHFATKFSAICHITRKHAYKVIDNLNCKQFTNSDCNAALVLATQPALAAVLAEAMAAEFATPAQKGAGAPPPSVPQANKDTVCTSPNGPTGCKSPTCPGKTSDNSITKDSVLAANDGKIDFRGHEETRAKADSQCRELGYKSIDDMLQQSTTVEPAKVNKIMQGGDFTCKPHEAIAALRARGSVQSNVKGEASVKLTERAVRHYVCGERRKGNKPDINRLCQLPRAVDSIRHSTSHHWEIDNRPVLRIDGETLPKSAQTVYTKTFGEGKSKVFAYTDSGILNGWQLN